MVTSPYATGMHGPSTSVVIATHRRARLLERVLRGMAAGPLPAEVGEILVVENGDRDETEAICDRYRDRLPIRYHFVEEPGKSNALNVALSLTGAELIVLFDDDILVDPATLQAFVVAARKYGPGHYFGGPVRPEYAGEPPEPWLRPSLTTCVLGWDLGEDEQPCDEFLGANWAAFRADLLRAGGFMRGLGPNATFRTVGQEVEMQERLAKVGCKGVYLPGATILHHVPAHQCTLAWARKRRYQQHLTWIMLSPKSLDAPMIAGVPRFLWRQWATELVKVLFARMTAPRTQRRVKLEMALAATMGKMGGYRRLQRVGAFSDPAGQGTAEERGIDTWQEA